MDSNDTIKELELQTFSMDPSPQKLMTLLTKNYPGSYYHGIYETGFCGF